jgi:hypothetical protein
MATLQDGHGDYTNRSDKAMRGEPEAVGDCDLNVFVEKAHASDADRVAARVTRENDVLRRIAQAHVGEFTKLRAALHQADALPNAERSLNLARRIAHDLEKLGESLT